MHALTKTFLTVVVVLGIVSMTAPAATAASPCDVGTQSEHPDLMSEHPDLMSEHPDLMSEHPDLMSEHPDLMSEHPDLMTC